MIRPSEAGIGVDPRWVHHVDITPGEPCSCILQGLIAFDGELLLQGVHDNVDVILLNGCSKA